MSGREHSKSLQDHLKQLFKRGTSTAFRLPCDYSLSDDQRRNLSPESPLSRRLKTIKDLTEIVTIQKLQAGTVELLWGLTEDLFMNNQLHETKVILYNFLQCLIRGQAERLELMRAQFFRFIKSGWEDEDNIAFKFDVLSSLTNGGKTAKHFEEEVAPFLIRSYPIIEKVFKVGEYLDFVNFFIRYNAAYVDDSDTTEILKILCKLFMSNTNLANLNKALTVLETIVAYGSIPSDSLQIFIATLCRSINFPDLTTTSWKVMRNLLGTHLGHASLFNLCRLLQDPDLHRDTYLMRGALCYMQMGLWGDEYVTTLKYTPSAVLPSILQVTETRQPEIAFEVVMAMKMLIKKCGRKMHDPEWEIIMEILIIVIQQIEEIPNNEPHKVAKVHLHETLNLIENMIEIGDFYGQEDHFYKAIEECVNSRPEESVFKLIAHLAQDIIPIRHLWFSNLNNLLQKFYHQETRTNVKVKTINVLTRVVKLNRAHYEDELIDRIVVPHLSCSVNDPDSLVRKEIVDLLIILCTDCETKKCLEMLDILERLLIRPFELYPSDCPVSEFEIADVKHAVLGLINLFTHKIHRLPSYHAIKIYSMLVTYLEHHYAKPKIFEDCSLIRLRILDCFLKMRADSLCHIGCPDASGKLQFSQYLCVTYQGSEKSLTSPPPVSPGPTGSQQQTLGTITNVPLRRVFKIFITCLKQEKDWEVLNLVLHGISQVLQNKSLILSKQGNDKLDLLVSSLVSMLIDRRSLNLPDSLKPPAKVSRSDFHAAVLKVMANLASYHMFLDPIHQQKIVRCFVKYGLVHKCAKQCINALTICTLEMREVMVKLLPEVLLDLSKMTATRHIAVSVLEFLSTLTKLPTVYANFVGDQYMAVFAISLPYTNPFKYNHYVVSLAHHVIAVWFLKCRLPFRRDFITYITKGLQTNVLVPFKETNILRSDLSKLNEDSSNRKRSSSLTEQSSRRRERASTTTTRPDFSRPLIDSTLLTFYEELTETCIDLMARYTFSSCSALPRRCASSEYLLNNGHSMTWFLGNKLITITTTGCSQKPFKQGLCDKCWATCRFQSLKSSLDENLDKDEGKEDTARTSSASSQTSQSTRQNSSATESTGASSPLDESKKLSDKLEESAKLSSQLPKDGGGNTNLSKQLCICWCQGWAEIYIRRATGDISWIMRMQNQLSHYSMNDYPFSDLSTLYISSSHQKDEATAFGKQATTTGSAEESSTATISKDDDEVFHGYSATRGSSAATSIPISIPSSPHKQSPSRQNSRDSIDEDREDDMNEDGSKTRNPVRRSNSSPEMSASWKNPFLQKQEREHEEVRVQEEEGAKKSSSKTFSKDMRVSCEAIPEEIAGMGTTPPSNDPATTTSATSASSHPTLWSCHSYPGSAPPTEQQISTTKSSHTVPPSPNIISGPAPPLTLPLTQSVHAIKSPILKNTTHKSDSTESYSSDKSSERSTLQNLPPLTTKPPQSPTQTSPRLVARHIQQPVFKDGHEIQKSSSLNLDPQKKDPKKEASEMKQHQISSSNISLSSSTQKRDRGYTISVMSTTRKPRLENLRRAISTTSRPRENPRSGMSPSFVFLQLYHSAQFGSTYEKPLLVSTTPVIQRALKVIDCIPPYETHRIGVLCVREGQCNNEVEILRNCFGSMRYTQFLKNLGSLIKLKDVDSQVVFLGGLEQDGNDGKFTYIWQDDVIRVTFHIATLMPNKESDPNCHKKKLHIGNDNVTIVYNESGEDYNINTIKGQFNFACIIVEPLDYKTNKVTVKAKDKLIELMGVTEPKIVSDQNVALLARQLALHADLASLVSRSLKSQSDDPYASNWLERLRKIKNIQAKVMQETTTTEYRGTASSSAVSSSEETTASRAKMEDFTEYT